MILTGKNKEVLPSIFDNFVDSIVTDPPYELGFMGKKWDSSGIAYDVELWKECYRVLKPGGYLLAFGGTRTQHRMVCAIEDAGFEIRDMISWVFGQGFPKSLDVGKAVDALQGNEREIVGTKTCGYQVSISKTRLNQGHRPNLSASTSEVVVDRGNSEWEGWGTALKPAFEPIVVARKPLSEKTVALNVLKWGTGGINIDGCRVDYLNEDDKESARPQGKCTNKVGALAGSTQNDNKRTEFELSEHQGRFPANFIHDGSEEVVSLFPNTTSGAMKKAYAYTNNGFSMGAPTGETKHLCEASSGSAARFFYVAKASKSERNFGLEAFENKQRDDSRKEGNPGGDNPLLRGLSPVQNVHPTVKPIALMRYLCRLVTPKEGTVLDPFCGSGTTGIGAKLEGLRFIGIEMNPEYVKIAEARIEAWEKEPEKLTLF